MIKMTSRLAVVALAASFAGETFASEWNVSVWGKRRAFTEHVEKLAELVSAKTNGEFTMNVSYGGLSKNKENLDGISIGAFEMAQFCAGYHRDKNRRHRFGTAVPWRRKPRSGSRCFSGSLCTPSCH